MNLFKLLWLNITFYILLVLFSFTAIPLLYLFIGCQVPFSSRRRILRLIRKAIVWYGSIVIYRLPRPLIRILYEDHTGGRRPRPAIVVCNHKSSSDPFLMAALPIGEMIQIVNKWPFRLPVWGFGARMANYLSINEMPVENFFAQGGSLLRDGVTLVAFPEGTRARSREMGQFHGTLFRLAIAEKAPIIPVCICGNERTPPRGTMLLNPAVVRIRQLPALTWDDYKDMNPFQLKNHVRNIIAGELDTMEDHA